MKKNIQQINIENYEIDVSRSTSNGMKNRGFAMLFTVVIISAVSIITAGLTNAIYKQIVLSSLARDSQTAFYQADTASDCALYADLVVNTLGNHPEYFNNTNTNGQPWLCGNPNDVTDNLIIKFIPNPDPSIINYTIEPTPTIVSDGGPCFKIDVVKTPGTDINGNAILNVVVKARGYNLCDMNNSRTVEREIETDYNQ